MQKAAREAVGEVDEREVLPLEHWLLPQPEQPGVQLHAGCGEPLGHSCKIGNAPNFVGGKGKISVRSVLNTCMLMI